MSIDSAIVYTNKALPIYRNLGDTDKEGMLMTLLGNIYLVKDEPEKASQYLLKADNILSNSKNYNSKAMLNHVTAISELSKKNYSKATDYYKKNIQYYNEGKKIDKLWVSYAYQGLFANSFVQTNYSDSFTYVNTFIDFVKKNNPTQLKESYRQLGAFYCITQDYKRGISSFKKGLDLSKKDLDLAASFNANIGMTYIELNKLDSAKIYLNKAKTYYESKADNTGLSFAYYGLAQIEDKDKKYVEAERLALKSIELAPENNLLVKQNIPKSLLYKVRLNRLIDDSIGLKSDLSKRKELENITQKLTENFNDIKNSNNPFLSPDFYYTNLEEISKGNEYLGNYVLALDYYKKSVKEREKVYGLDKMRKLSEAQSDYELTQERIRVKLQEETKRLQLQKEIELKELRMEYEKKQAAAKTEEERKRLLLEEDLKRREIQLTYEQRQKEQEQKYIQERQLAKINQEKKDALAKADLESSKLQKNIWAVGTGLSLLLLGFAGFSYVQKRKDNQKIAEEKQKSDDLLLNILPHEVAEELKEKGETAARHYDKVSVLFTDFVNFTVNSEKMGVQEVLNELNICFTEFDRIMDKYGLEKIKTIGDAYLAVSGLPVSNPKHAQNSVNAGLEIIDFIKDRKQNNPNALDIRIGIHSGPVIAGIVGVKKFAYDIWGDTVNTAARMEQNSEKGKLNISGSTYELVKGNFYCEYRGKIETKGKGALDMYFVNKN